MRPAAQGIAGRPITPSPQASPSFAPVAGAGVEGAGVAGVVLVSVVVDVVDVLVGVLGAAGGGSLPPHATAERTKANVAADRTW